MRYEGGVIINGLRPHGKSIVRGSYRILRRGHDIFIERVYGRIRIDKGRASSFFLKQIAEHQEKGAGHKRGL